MGGGQGVLLEESKSEIWRVVGGFLVNLPYHSSVMRNMQIGSAVGRYRGGRLATTWGSVKDFGIHRKLMKVEESIR